MLRRFLFLVLALGTSLGCEASATTAPDTGVEVPSGAVMFYDLPACPAGWSEFGAARGRAIVGLPSGGTLGGTVGPLLSDLEERSHTHTMAPLAVNTSEDGEHSHVWAKMYDAMFDWITFDSSGEEKVIFDWDNGIDNEGEGIFPLARQVPSNFVIHYTDRQGTHTHQVMLPESESSDAGTGDVMPYVQMLTCRKN